MRSSPLATRRARRSSAGSAFPAGRHCEIDVLGSAALTPGRARKGPLVVETPLTTIVVDPESSITACASGSLVIRSD